MAVPGGDGAVLSHGNDLPCGAGDFGVADACKGMRGSRIPRMRRLWAFTWKDLTSHRRTVRGGAHPLVHTRDPDWDEFCRYQEAAGGRIRILTLAPERKGSLAFIKKASDAGVIVGLGHTGASRAPDPGGGGGWRADVHPPGQRSARGDSPPR